MSEFITLESKLAEIREGAKERMPVAAIETMHRATEELRSSGITARALKEGAGMPSFNLPDIEERQVSSDDLLAKGPLVVTFYRGDW